MEYRIVAPVCSVEEIDPVIEAGADEIYFGIMPPKWVGQYGNADLITRRQSELAHFASYDDLSEIVRKVNSRHCLATLVLNARYSTHQLPYIYEILEQWEARGGHAVMVADIELLLWLNDNHSKLKKQLSVMAGVFNSHSIGFFEQLDVARIVLPREMTVSEMKFLLKNASKSTEYETIIMFQKCRFIDSFCNFYHAFNYRPYIVHDYAGECAGLPIIENFHPGYEGHGCQMDFLCSGKKVKHADNNDFTTPFCAACSLEKLSQAGIRHFKIAGRGYPVELIVNSIRFVRQVVETETKQQAQIKRQYASAFGRDCSSKNCYYR